MGRDVDLAVTFMAHHEARRSVDVDPEPDPAAGTILIVRRRGSGDERERTRTDAAEVVCNSAQASEGRTR